MRESAVIARDRKPPVAIQPGMEKSHPQAFYTGSLTSPERPFLLTEQQFCSTIIGSPNPFHWR
jgi:hypothetical protein